VAKKEDHGGIPLIRVLESQRGEGTSGNLRIKVKELILPGRWGLEKIRCGCGGVVILVLGGG